MEFQDDLAGGVTLVRPALQSPDYVPGVSGWSVKSDGSAEFNDAVIRGGVVVSGTQLYYDPAPGAGNLVMSVAAEAGTDEYGNAYGRGVVWYTAGAPKVQIGDNLPGLLGSSGVTAYAPELNRLVALAQGSLVFAPTETPWQAPGGVAFTVQQEYDPPVHTLQLLSGRPTSAQKTALLYLHSETTDNPAQVTVRSSSSAADDLLLDVRGDVEIGGQITSYDENAFTSWTPVISGGGAATFNVRDGWWQRIGKMIHVYAYFTVGTAGTGATPLTMTLPVVPWRGAGDRRQFIPGDVDGVGTSEGPVAAVCFAGGSGATVERIQLSNATDATGATLAAGSVWTFQGWYREA